MWSGTQLLLNIQPANTHLMQVKVLETHQGVKQKDTCCTQDDILIRTQDSIRPGPFPRTSLEEHLINQACFSGRLGNYKVKNLKPCV